MKATTSTRRWWMPLVILLLTAFALRVWCLTEVPPGLTHDEASNGHDSAAILRGVHRLYFPVGYGHEPLYNYSVALTTLLLGQSIFTLRITTVAWSMVQMVFAIALARRWWGRTAAIGAAAAYATSFWALMMARVGLRAPVLPALLTGAILAYDHAVRGRRTSYLLAGVLLGAGFYTYMASRGTPLIFVGLLVLLALSNRSMLRRVAPGTLAVVAIALLVGAPLFLYLRAHPELEQRIAQLGGALAALRAGDARPLFQNISASLPMLFWRGDPRWLYNIGGRPGLEPLLTGLFVVGIITLLIRWVRGNTLSHARGEEKQYRTLRASLLLLWLGVGVAPALLAPVEYNLLHAISAMPAALLTAALGFNTVWRVLRRTVIHHAKAKQLHAVLVVGLGLLIGATGISTARAYFVTWGRHRDVRVAYHHHVVALGRYLDNVADDRPAVITSLYPAEVHDPYTMEVTLRRPDLLLRWVDGRGALFFPQQTTLLFIEAQTHPPNVLWQLVQPDLTPLTTLRFEPDDIPLETHAYTWDAPSSWTRLAPTLYTAVHIQPGDPPPATHHTPVTTPVTFSSWWKDQHLALQLVGYQLVWDETAPETALNVLTAWEVRAAPTNAKKGSSPELVLFAHLLDQEGTLVEQKDVLNAPAWQWKVGDRFVQLHRLELPDDYSPTTHAIAIGAYKAASVERLIVTETAGRPVDDTTPITRVLVPIQEMVK